MKGRALVSRMPLNVTASFTKLANLFPGRGAQVRDRHHDLYGEKLNGKVLVFPSCIGSTYTGLLLLELIKGGEAPVAMVVQQADSLLVSGLVLAEVWFGQKVPLVQYESNDLFEAISSGDEIEVDADNGSIRIL
jgi:predicted aconitase with swiveling domain